MKVPIQRKSAPRPRPDDAPKNPTHHAGAVVGVEQVSGWWVVSVLMGAVPAPPEATQLVAETSPQVKLQALEVSPPHATVVLEVPAEVPLRPVPVDVENAFESLVGYLEATRPEIHRVELRVAHPGARPVAPPRLAPPIRTPLEPEAAPKAGPVGVGAPGGQPFVRLPESLTPFGRALAGRTIAISPGHGYIFYERLGRFSTQRANLKWPGCGSCRGLTEDFGTHALVTRYLIPLLEGAGADVILLRERSENGAVTLVDDGAAAFASSGRFVPGTASGGHAGGYQAGLEAQSEARWTLSAPGGRAWLSTWFVSGSNRLENAILSVGLPGEIPFTLTLDQTRAGQRWVPIWPLDVPAGSPVEIRLSYPVGAPSDRALIADAMRLGAGRHASNHPWWQMGAQPFAEHQEAPASVRDRSDVTARPAYAELFGADAYLSIHSNASGLENSSAQGTVTYRYSCGAVPDHTTDPDPATCDDPVGSDRLQANVHSALIRSLRERWDPGWRDRGPKAANFGEVRELSTIPGVLVETAFHDNMVVSSGARMTDNQALQDPRWRQAAARGLYEGLSRFLEGEGVPLLAEAPTHLVAERVAAGQVRLRFRAAANARAYRVELSTGSGFRPGPQVSGSPAVIDVPEGLSLGLRLRSVNEAGLGTPSRAVACWAGVGPSRVLIVDAFERRDAWVQTEDNRGDTAIVHGVAVGGAVGFDGAQEDALEDGDVELGAYQALVFALGRESTEHEVLTPALRARVRTYVEGGGFVFMGGTEVGWALDRRGTDESRSFLREVFGARYVADDAESRQVRGAGPLAGSFGTVAKSLAGPGERAPEAFFTDVLGPEPGFEAALTYGDGAVAAVAGRQTLVAGFALDHLSDREDRGALLGGWLAAALDGTWSTRDVGPRMDASGGQDTVSGPTDTGALPPDASSPDLGLTPISSLRLRAPIEGGCGCRAEPPPDAGARSIGWALTAAFCLLLSRRQREARRIASVRYDAER